MWREFIEQWAAGVEWDHEVDSRTMVAPNLARYLEWQLTGQLPLP